MLAKVAQHTSLVVLALSPFIAGNSHAVEQGDWLVRFGAVNVSPNDKSGTFSNAPTLTAEVDGDTQIFLNASYMIMPNIAIELLAATPFEHTISVPGVGPVATAKQLPPTLSVQYHFKPKDKFRPYVGGGLNYTTFFSEKVTAPTVISTISLDDSWGLAVQGGFDVDINKDWFANVDLRYINIETTASTTGGLNVGNVDVEINPWVFSAGVGMRF